MQYYAADRIMKECGGFTERSKLLATDGVSRERETKCERSVSIGSCASDQQGIFVSVCLLACSLKKLVWIVTERHLLMRLAHE